MLTAWAKKNWYWLTGGVLAAGTVYAIRRRAKALGEAPALPLWRSIRSGPKGEIAAYVGPTGRCQPCEFLDETPKPLRKRIDREFDHVVNKGPSYWSMHFHPLSNQAPLWKVKVFDHRLYGVPESQGDWLRFILLRGWVKDKAGKACREEATQINASQKLFQEYARRRGQGGR